MAEINRQGTSKYIYILKAFAIFSVVCAYVGNVSESATKPVLICSKILSYVGIMGVPIFFLLSGYLFDKNIKSFQSFWKKKVTSIIIPWLFCETILWLYVVARKGGLGIKQWILFIIGYQHTTYYLSVLMILYLLFWIVKKEWQIYVLMVISISSIISTGWNIGICGLNEWFGTYYLNFLNWLIFFAVGLIISRREWLESMQVFTMRGDMLLISAFISISYFVICNIRHIDIWYFSKYCLISHVANIVLLSGLAGIIKNIKSVSQIMCKVGKYSFSIYLLHQFFAGMVVAAANKLGGMVVIRPFVVIGIIMLGIMLLEKCFDNNRAVQTLLGMR